MYCIIFHQGRHAVVNGDVYYIECMVNFSIIMIHTHIPKLAVICNMSIRVHGVLDSIIDKTVDIFAAPPKLTS